MEGEGRPWRMDHACPPKRRPVPWLAGLPADAQTRVMAGGDHGGDTSGLRDTWLQRPGD